MCPVDQAGSGFRDLALPLNPLMFSMCSNERAGWHGSRDRGFSNRDLGKRAENFTLRTLQPGYIN